jgi:hypothetical protein
MRWLLVLTALVALAGCASNPPDRQTSSSSASHARCLVNPRADDSMRPLFFLFCIQQP